MILSGFPRFIRFRVSPLSQNLKQPKNNLQTLSHSTYHHGIVSCLSTIPSKPISSSQLQIPMFLREPIYSATVSDLEKWKNWAKTLVYSVGSKFLEIDNGPEVNTLCREIQWLIEDVVVEEQRVSTEEKVVKLRTEMDQLYFLWKQRIEMRRPFQYIVGCEHWRDLILCVQEGVLIPRPETEKIVELVQEVVAKDNGLSEGLWADLGTGSGALAIAIVKVLGTQGNVIATDLSPIAASVAEFNVKRYDLQDKVEIRQGSWLEPLEDLKGKLAGFISNPPYIPSDQIFGLQAEVGKHEPRLALDGGENGMDDLLHLCEGATSMLKPGGFFAFETNGEKQSKFLVNFMMNHPESIFQDVRIVADFAGIERFVTGFCQ
ncbi:hypothetical protein C5167_011605 [Papaver somniferum]|uniref:Methyltransferase small domain-containing protein n=1 Tax=Papaver somniferum TaxID=3469 RepID=A0A4Y7K6T2_PAPSO|nr:uncharacterized protein LOC113290191 [Papaver somniferum]RZC67921.1 hypothetical protein C5167_011605 [Papaver somniferum]